jgi:hypothetical protein
MRIVELIIDEEAELYGIDAISLVDRPAIELDFIALKEQRVQFAEVDADKRVLIGPALVPDKPIFRKNGEDEFYVYFSKNTVRKASELYLKHGNQAKHTLEHEHQIHGLTVVESWIVENKEQDKSHLYDLDVPVGTWMVAVKVDNEAIWQEWGKEGKVKGFSIEGYFVDKMKKNAEDEMLAELAKAIVKTDKRTKSGTRVVMESYSDYPEAVRNNAKRGRELNEKHGNKCATRTGRIRSAQLEAGEPVSLETVKRMASYLARAEEYYDPSDTSACGTISYLLWGGKAAKRWAESKLKEELCQALEHELAEIGPRGGVKESKKAPKSDTKNPNPKRGSDKNKPGDASKEGKVKVPKEVEEILQKKSDEFNERYKEDLGYGVSVAKLRVVYQRGVGAFQTSHSPEVKSQQQWALARVNAFLYLVKNGRPQNKKYTGDNDLLPEKHPKSEK